MADESKIIHIDMDAFFASIEQRDKPELQGKPIAVGGDGTRGVVSTASYEARKYGIHSAMSMAKAKKLCPQLIVVSSDHTRYRNVSLQVHDIFSKYTDIIEPLSIDEAFLDVTNNTQSISAEEIAIKIKKEIRENLNLTASAGVSYNKFLSKIASDYNKPDGLFVITEKESMDFIAMLPVEKFWGIGPKTASVMHQMGIFSGLQLRQCSLNHLVDVFGKMGTVYYNFARGIDTRKVEPMRQRKSVGCEQTFINDITKKSAILIELYHIVVELVGRLNKNHFNGCTLTLKVKFFDFTQVTRSVTKTKALKTKNDILPLAKELMLQTEFTSKAVRLIGLSVSNPSETSKYGDWVEGELDFKD